jgi:hypothetical protein
MRFNRLQGFILAVMLLMVGSFVAVNLMPVAHAQSATTGAISGEVKDPAGLAVPNALVTITNSGTNATEVIKSNSEGRYTANQLNPGIYKVSASAANLQSSSTELEVLIGTTVTADIKLTPAGHKETVEVVASTLPLVDTQNVALESTFNEQQIQDLPAPGGDVTTVAFTAPGVVVNVGGGYGNFSANGIPGISNLFVLNGFDNQDPFLNLNNSGSSNLTLGQGELAEATVVENGYNSQFGRAAGVTIQYTTQSGTNKFHGEADYNYNGTALNANGWFFKQQGVARPHAVSNEWAGNAGGPIIKDKLFFFADYEGLNYVLPGAAGFINYPSSYLQKFAAFTYPGNLVDTGLLNTANALYQGAATYGSATPMSLDATTQGGCGPFLAGVSDPLNSGGVFGVNEPCMTQAYGSANNLNKEWLFTGRLDWQINDKHRIFGRYKMDRGSQPTGTSFINPAFNVVSIQPEYEGQLNDSYQLSSTKTNVFIMAANWYTAYFGPANIGATQGVFPWDYITDAGFDGSGNNNAGGLTAIGAPYYFPQGRNVTQYQFQDDFSWTKGRHNLKFGANFRRDLVSDYDAQVLQDFPLAYNFFLLNYAAGFDAGDGEYVQNYPAFPTAHLKLYNLGVYAQDEFQVNQKLKLTLGVRVDRTGKPFCKACYSLYANGTFPSAGAGLSQPYNAADGGSINSINNTPWTSQDVVNIQPRFGFNYSINEKTEIRGGVGLFSDLYPAGFLDGAIQNFPNVNSITTFFGNLDSATADPGNSVTWIANKANGIISNGYTSGQSASQISSALDTYGITYAPPAIGAYFPGKFQTPIYAEYNLQIQREINKNAAIIINYTGNYGYHEVLQNPWLNAGSGNFNYNGDNQWDDVNNDFVGVPVAPPDPSFSRVTAYTNSGHSNYNGVFASLKFNGHGITAQATYDYSHALDTISNGGEGETFGGSALTGQLTPSLVGYNLNYSNADYDIRNNFTADLVYDERYKNKNFALNEILGGWTVGAKVYARTGTPFSITNSKLSGESYEATGPNFMAQSLVPENQIYNSSHSNPHTAANGVPALHSADFLNPLAQNTLGNIRRNDLYGPGYKNVDISLTKSLYKHERIDFKIGANAYNVFNNVNFNNPGTGLGSSSFGFISSTVTPPTSPYGSFQGNGVTQRLVQIHGKFTF